MAESTQVRPRPKPKPKAKAALQDSASISGPSSSGTLSTSSPLKRPYVQDNDEMFIRNRKRSYKTWETLEKLDKKSKVIEISSDSDSEITSPRPRKQKKRDNETSWQKLKDPRLLSVDLSDQSDDDVEIVGMSTPKGKQVQKGKARQRSRSRSITPPPSLPLHQIQNARNLVRQTLDNSRRSASPTQYDVDETAETIFSDPELARIAQLIALQPPSQTPTRASSLADENPDTVTLSVKWRPHPLKEGEKEAVWVFKMNRDDNFRDLFEATAEEASIAIENLIMTYNGTRLYSSVTPATLKMWGEAELVACDKPTHEYIRENPLATTTIPPTTPTGGTKATITSPEKGQETNAGSDDDDDDDAFKLILRSNNTKDITLTVRPTTKCGAIVKAFLKKAGIADQYPKLFTDNGGGGKKSAGRKKNVQEKDPRLCIDGDKMDNNTEISEAGLDDGDLVEVVGL